MDLSKLPMLEMAAGKAVLEALTACAIENDASADGAPTLDGVHYVWKAPPPAAAA